VRVNENARNPVFSTFRGKNVYSPYYRKELLATFLVWRCRPRQVWGCRHWRDCFANFENRDSYPYVSLFIYPPMLEQFQKW